MKNIHNLNKKPDSEKLESMLSILERIEARLENMSDTMLKLWKAEDEEENDGNYRWPFDKDGNLLLNVNFTGKTDGK